jgi:hypothetical protein
MGVVPLRRPAGSEAGRDESLGSMKQKYQGKDLQGLVDLGHEQGYLTFDHVCGELLILAECTVEVQTCESFAHG